mgnify:CR=1 FL=1
MIRQGNNFSIDADIERVRNGIIIITLEILEGKIIKSKLEEVREKK